MRKCIGSLLIEFFVVYYTANIFRKDGEHMDEYVLEYRQQEGRLRKIHPSWYKLCEEQTKKELIAQLKKRLYEPGEYTLHFAANTGTITRQRSQCCFEGTITRKGVSCKYAVDKIAYVDFDYLDDVIEACDFRTTYPLLNFEDELTNPTARFVITGKYFYPSPKEDELAVERFWKRIQDSVAFSLDLDGDYPDTIFEICYADQPSQELRESTVKVIEKYAAQYNKRHEDGIHYVGDFTDNMKMKQPHAVYVHVDFGDCPVNALASVIKAIGKSGLPIVKLALK